MSEAKAIETFKSMVGLATEGLKALLLVNGGAVVALLTFVGNSKAISPSAGSFVLPAGFFLLGLVFCVAAFCTAYATQYTLYNEQFPERGFQPRSHMKFFWWTSALVAGSLAAFSAGAISSVCGFSAVKPIVEVSTARQTISAVPPQAPSSASIGSPRK
ncbi:hypothetical protein EIP75_23610 [Aquabacterium soli]|uniref:Uncharacterized protein n=2 Tax=Aquabacterium soli TaxID=2493092 RepID=A0A426UZ97_9BURK|nr:hypothetical protein EIP75_23610 [Aquabacterium soli]